MSSILILQDGTEFDIRCGESGRPVVVDFNEGELEKLLRTRPDEPVTFCDKRIIYAEFQRRIDELGGIAAYIPNPTTYLRVANHL